MRYISLITTLLISILSFSQVDQNNLVDHINKNVFFHKYDIENFYLHTNKAVYFTGENIFFKAYVVNELDNTPNMETKNLHINLYDFENKLISSQLFHVENGNTFGSIKLPLNLKSGQYTLQLGTQWNRNFKPGSNFNIIVNNIEEPEYKISTTNSIETTNEPITFYPESGSLIKNNENVIYFKVKSDNPEEPIGKIVETKTGRRIAKIYAINNDYAKSTFFYDSELTAIFNINDKKEEIIIPEGNKTGFVLYKTKTNKKDVLNFQLSTNKETIKNQKFIYAVLHKKGTIKTKASFNLTENILNYNFNILKSDLFPGLNTISVFDDQDKLIIERSFFYTDKKKTDILAKVITETKDSTTLDLNLINIAKATNISISVMHQDSQVIDDNSNITSTLLYQDSNFNTPQSTDLYFQQQNLNNSFVYQSKNNQELHFNKEYGVKLIGQLNGSLKQPKNYKVALNSNTNAIFALTELNADKKFTFEKLYLTHPSEYSLILLNKKGMSLESRFYVYNITTDYKAFNTLQNNKSKNNFIKPRETKIAYKQTEFNTPTFISENVEALDEVVLDDVINKQKKRIKEIKRENPFLAMNAGFSREYLIDSEKETRTLEQYLSTLQGISVRTRGRSGTVEVYTRRAGGNFKPENLIDISIDNIFITQEYLGGLQNSQRPITDFELVSVNLSGVGNGTIRQNGIIHLITRKGKSITGKNYISKNHKTTNGYTFNQKQLDNSNLFYDNKTSENAFSTIDWLPDVTLNPNTTNIIKIKKPEGEHVKLIINGISLDGELIYKVVEL
ncbi:hypothetical protein [Olleya sp. Bg11-27]|uniref:hypothetical protein n=1 Tax=Olleya sp. Bg11-27 TaxID=2058135 RepID=UPI000C306B70|nr:hypothetical protein [Olleya sp. Bg11-27]AUC76095.1 hypothetical protein CW732_10645 [Olleya sp. Bg11-27]